MLNVITLVGRLTDNPTTTKINEKDRAKFTIAFNNSKDGAGEFIDCLVNESLTECVLDNLSKGDKIVVSGQLSVRKYTAKDNTTRVSPSINVKTIEFIDLIKFNTQDDGVIEEPVEEKPQPTKPATTTSSRRR